MSFSRILPLICLGNRPDKPDFVGSPYEFWVGSNVGIGTSVGQIRVNDVVDRNDVSYDLLHGYEEGGKFQLCQKINKTNIFVFVKDY